MLGVGMLRRGEDIVRRAALDDLAIGHHAHPVRHLAHDAEIVGDEQHRHVEFRFELEQQVEDLRLDGHVERGGRLIGDQQVRLVGERHGDHHPLPLAARELMRIGVEAAFRVLDADLVEEIEHARLRCAVRQTAMDLEHLADLLLDGVKRVERGHRLLKNHGNLIAADMAEPVERQRHQILVLESDDA